MLLSPRHRDSAEIRNIMGFKFGKILYSAAKPKVSTNLCKWLLIGIPYLGWVIRIYLKQGWDTSYNKKKT